MKFSQLILSKLSNWQTMVWNEQSPFSTTVHLDDYSLAEQKYNSYKKRLIKEKDNFNSALEEAIRNHDIAFRKEQERIASEHERQLYVRKRNKIIFISIAGILVLLGLAVGIIFLI